MKSFFRKRRRDKGFWRMAIFVAVILLVLLIILTRFTFFSQASTSNTANCNRSTSKSCLYWAGEAQYDSTADLTIAKTTFTLPASNSYGSYKSNETIYMGAGLGGDDDAAPGQTVDTFSFAGVAATLSKNATDGSMSVAYSLIAMTGSATLNPTFTGGDNSVLSPGDSVVSEVILNINANTVTFTTTDTTTGSTTSNVQAVVSIVPTHTAECIVDFQPNTSTPTNAPKILAFSSCQSAANSNDDANLNNIVATFKYGSTTFNQGSSSSNTTTIKDGSLNGVFTITWDITGNTPASSGTTTNQQTGTFAAQFALFCQRYYFDVNQLPVNKTDPRYINCTNLAMYFQEYLTAIGATTWPATSLATQNSSLDDTSLNTAMQTSLGASPALLSYWNSDPLFASGLWNYTGVTSASTQNRWGIPSSIGNTSGLAAFLINTTGQKQLMADMGVALGLPTGSTDIQLLKKNLGSGTIVDYLYKTNGSNYNQAVGALETEFNQLLGTNGANGEIDISGNSDAMGDFHTDQAAIQGNNVTQKKQADTDIDHIFTYVLESLPSYTSYSTDSDYFNALTYDTNLLAQDLCSRIQSLASSNTTLVPSGDITTLTNLTQNTKCDSTSPTQNALVSYFQSSACQNQSYTDGTYTGSICTFQSFFVTQLGLTQGSLTDNLYSSERKEVTSVVDYLWGAPTGSSPTQQENMFWSFYDGHKNPAVNSTTQLDEDLSTIYLHYANNTYGNS